MCRSNRSVVAVSQDSNLADLLDALVDVTDYDIVIVESMARGYARIKQVAPDGIIVLMDMDDPAVCQLLSMLKTDSDTFDVPIVTWTKRPSLPQPSSRPALATAVA
jgi:DNA-binding response OmpR family regulator